MKKLALLFLCLMLTSCGFTQSSVTKANLLPASTGYNLGSNSQRWNAFIQNLDINGNLTFKGQQAILNTLKVGTVTTGAAGSPAACR